MSITELYRQIKNNSAKVFRTAKIKRRDIITGNFESDWFDITRDVKSFGKIKQEIDPARLNTFSFSNTKLVVANYDGSYNPEDNEASYWNGYLNQQRTLVQIQAGFLHQTLGSSGQWISTPIGQGALYDYARYDEDVFLYDDPNKVIQFTGIISGDISLSDKNEVVFNLKPLTSIFQDYPANQLTGWTSTGYTASDFMIFLRDQTDGSGNFIFRPFFGNTTTNWNISTTTNIYSNLNTATANGVIDATCWDIITKLAEAENFVPFISRDGTFNFTARTANTTTVSFEFHGVGSFNNQYGHTIKSVTNYGKKITKYYNQVNVKFSEANTATSYYTKSATLTVSPINNVWVLGMRKLDIQNYFIPNTATAQTIANNIYTEYSALQNEITFTTTFVPHLNLLDRIAIWYDPSGLTTNNLWDLNDWADNTITTDLLWDSSKGDSMKIQGEEFKFLSIEIDLDKLENTFIAREA